MEINIGDRVKVVKDVTVDKTYIRDMVGKVKQINVLKNPYEYEIEFALYDYWLFEDEIELIGEENV